MLKAIDSTKEDAPKFGQETNKDNMVVGSGWSRERHDDDKKVIALNKRLHIRIFVHSEK